MGSSTTNDETPKHKVKEERLKKMPSLSMNQKEEIESNFKSLKFKFKFN